ncbi:hypothetical protein [Streptomyces exfoliatus]|uniref:hypothetical protein n=1 Tax=Streptomyces exfoliatus TaxID=1905 RepID=UPI003CCC2C88
MWTVAAIGAVLVTVVLLPRKELIAVTLDHETARAAGAGLLSSARRRDGAVTRLSRCVAAARSAGEMSLGGVVKEPRSLTSGGRGCW